MQIARMRADSLAVERGNISATVTHSGGDKTFMQAAQYWADFIKAAGVREIFGLPGTESLELVEAAHKAGLNFVLTHHEASAAFMAAMRGRLTGIPGVALATRAPGASNLASGIAAAHMDRMPLLAVTGDQLEEEGQATHQRMPMVDVFAPITRISAQVSASSLPSDLPSIFHAATGTPPGPAFMAFPAPEAATEIDRGSVDTDIRRPDETHAVPDLDGVLEQIHSSKRAMIIAGLEVVNSRSGDELIRLAEKLNCPVADSPQLKGWFPNDHPLYAGTFGRGKQVAELANQSDLVLVIGFDTVEIVRPLDLKPPMIQLTSVDRKDPGIPAETCVLGDLRGMLSALAVEAAPAGSWDATRVRRARSDFLSSLVPRGQEPSNGAMWPQTVVAQLRRAMPRDGIVSVDVGSHKLAMVCQWESYAPDTFLCSSGVSAMGSGIPFGLTAKMTSPDKPVAAVIGDGGYLMYAGELATIARLGLPMVVVVMSDAALYSIKIKQLRRSYAVIGTEYEGVAPTEIARGFGLDAVRVTNLEECEKAFTAAFASDRPTVIEAVIDPAGYEYTQ